MGGLNLALLHTLHFDLGLLDAIAAVSTPLSTLSHFCVWTRIQSSSEDVYISSQNPVTYDQHLPVDGIEDIWA